MNPKRNQSKKTIRNLQELRVAYLLKGFEYEAYRFPYVIESDYIPDFVHAESKTIVEYKGRFRPDDRRKMVSIRKTYPDWHIYMVFENPNSRISKKSKTTYAEWAMKNGFIVIGIDKLKELAKNES